LVPDVIVAIIGKDDVELVGAALSARAETLLIRSRDRAALIVFIGLISWRLVSAEITEQD
jgi:hypothetical protein